MKAVVHQPVREVKGKVERRGSKRVLRLDTKDFTPLGPSDRFTKEKKEELDRQVQEYLSNGGRVTRG